MNPNTSISVEDVKRVLPPGSFLVGGAPRDRILGRTVKDLDFLVPGDPLALARTVAAELGGVFVPLDADRQIARVVLPGGFDLDFTPMPTEGVEADLARRDFTINAMAIRVDSGEWTDPFGGRADIEKGLLRAVREENLDEDPLRLLRAWRFRATLGFRIVQELKTAIQKRNHRVWKPAGERINEEWFKILQAPDASLVLEEMAAARTLFALFPELEPMVGCAQNEFHHLDVWEHTLETLRQIDKLERDPGYVFDLAAADLVTQYLALPLIADRPRIAYLRFALLLHDVGKPSTKQADADGFIHFYGHEKLGETLLESLGEKMKLATAEQQLIQKLIGRHMMFGPDIYDPDVDEDRFLYRLFRDFHGQDGLGLLLLSVADRESASGPALPKDYNAKHRVFVNRAVTRYIAERERVMPPKLISGEDIMRALEIPPSKRIGEILEEVQARQAEGRIRSRSEALEFVKSFKL